MEMAGKFDSIIIDAGGRDSPEQRSAILAADLIVIPTKASQYDLTSLDDMAAIIEDSLLINPHLKSVAVVNMAHANPNVSEVGEARDYLADFAHIRLIESVIRDRIIFRKSTRAGQAVVEMSPPDLKATAEIQSLYAEIFSD